MDALIIDDEIHGARAMKSALSAILPIGWRVECVSDAVQGRAILTLDSRIRLAVVDYLMPRFDGLRLVSDVLELRPELQGRIIISSGAQYPADIAHRLFEELGCLRCDKPVDLDLLDRLVSQAIAQPYEGEA